MDSIIRNVQELKPADRQVLEQVLGLPLHSNQQIHIQVVSPGNGASLKADSVTETLPVWCDVYAGLTDEEVADVEKVILQRTDLTRSSE